MQDQMSITTRQEFNSLIIGTSEPIGADPTHDRVLVVAKPDGSAMFSIPMQGAMAFALAIGRVSEKGVHEPTPPLDTHKGPVNAIGDPKTAAARFAIKGGSLVSMIDNDKVEELTQWFRRDYREQTIGEA